MLLTHMVSQCRLEYNGWSCSHTLFAIRDLFEMSRPMGMEQVYIIVEDH